MALFGFSKIVSIITMAFNIIADEDRIISSSNLIHINNDRILRS